MHARPGEPRGIRTRVVVHFPLLLKSSRNHCLGALAAALSAWLYLGTETGVVVFRAIMSAAIAGLILGRLALYLITIVDLNRWKTAALSGLITGLIIHPLMWSIFVTWSRWAVFFEGKLPKGSLLGDLYSALFWSQASVMYGFLVTIPAMTIAAYLTQKDDSLGENGG